jgi:hypothetical protein
MKRQYDYTVGPGSPNTNIPWSHGGAGRPGASTRGCGTNGGGIRAQDWKNEHIFERWGDDSIVYFTDTVDQAFLSPTSGGGLMPWFEDRTKQTGGNNIPSSENVVLKVPADHTATTFLCEESRNTKRTLVLGPGASAKVFVDAWEHYQTVPLILQVAAANQAPTIGQGPQGVSYQWSFFNYSPIGGSPTQGSGFAAYCPEINLSPPIIQTLGQTDRSPTGEYPVSEETKQKTCCCASERPFFVITNTEAAKSHGRNLIVVIKVAQ